MYDDVGRKIRGLAIAQGVIMLIICIIAWIILITNGYDTVEYTRYGYEEVHKYITQDDAIGWGCLIAGVFYFMSSWILYGFGQMVDEIECAHAVLVKIWKKLDQPIKTIVVEEKETAPSQKQTYEKTPAWKKVEGAAAQNATAAPISTPAAEPISAPAAPVSEPVAPAKEPAAFCQHCGHKREADAIFCQFCGNKF